MAPSQDTGQLPCPNGRDSHSAADATLAEAEDFIALFHRENPAAGPPHERLKEVRRQVESTGTYEHTSDELVFAAVLHSFRCAGVTITDHHTESVRFLKHHKLEERHGRMCPADWTWIVPPSVGSTTPVFHRYYDNPDLRPNFYRHAGLAEGRHGHA